MLEENSRNIENGIILQEAIEKAANKMGDLESAILLWLQWGYSKKEVREHFELTEFEMQYKMRKIRAAIRKEMEEK